MRTASIILLALLMLVFAARAASAAGSTGAVVGSAAPPPPPPPSVTRTIVSPGNAVAAPAKATTVTATVSDLSGTPSYPTGGISWDDSGAGGTFSPTTCVLSSVSPFGGKCSVSYTPIAGSVGTSVTLSATYLGDGSHLGSAGQSVLAVYFPAVVTITPRSVSLTSGKSITFIANVTDTSGTSKSAPTGSVSWDDGGAGGTFTVPACVLSSVTNSTSGCSVKYRAPATVTVAQTITVNASYSGDSIHGGSSVTTALSLTPAHVPMTVSFAIVGSGQGSFPPTFTYALSNVTLTAALTSVPTSYQADVGSHWFVPNQLGNSSQGAAWNLEGGAQGTVAYSFSTGNGGSSIAFVYYHQYLVNLGYKIVGGTAGASIPPFVTYTSFGVTRQTGAPGQTWVDVGTPYAYPAMLPGSLGDARWIARNVSEAAQSINGTATGPADLSVIYYHQYRLSVSFEVKDHQSGLVPPSIFAESLGVKFNASLGSLSSKVWFDAGSQYSLTDPLVGSNSTVRWYAGSGDSNVVTASNISVAYYRQYAVAASFTVTDGSVPSKVSNGSPTPVLATVVGASATKQVSLSFASAGETVWLDSDSAYTVSKVLFTLPGERWTATASVNGTVARGGEVSQTYYHQYLVKLSYLASGGPPSTFLVYTSLGAPANVPMPSSESTIWVDSRTSLIVQGSPPGERWFASNAQNGVVSSANQSFTYYHQYQIDVSLIVAGGGLPAQSSISGTSGGQPLKVLLGTQNVAVWLDGGTSYFVPQKLLQLPDERWVARADLTGTVASAASLVQTFYHQDLLNVTSLGAPSVPPPTMSYASFGVQGQAVVGSAGSLVWADAGTKFSLQNVIDGGTGERWYSALGGGNVTAPIKATALYFHQYLLTYSYESVGGSMGIPPSLEVVAAGSDSSMSLTNQSGHFWLDSGTHWKTALSPGLHLQPGERWVGSKPSDGTMNGPISLRLSYSLQFLVTTAPSTPSGGKVGQGGWYNASSPVTLQAVPTQGWTLGGWDGVGNDAYTGTNATISIRVLSPMNETAVFEPGLTIVSSSGGSVRYTTGPSVQSIGGGRSVQTFLPSKGQVTLEALASFPYQFVKWSGADGQGSNLLTLNVSGPTVIQAVFAPNYLDLVGLPAAVFASCLTVYLARHFILASGRQVLRNLRLRRKELKS